MRVGVISCCKEKLDRPAPARELYRSRLFRAASEWIETRTDRWVILSALHGVVDPDTILEPYDLRLDDMSPTERNRWADLCRVELSSRFGLDAIYLTVLGTAYGDALRGFPYVEDYIRHLQTMRRARGMTGRAASVGIGVLYRELRAGTRFGA